MFGLFDANPRKPVKTADTEPAEPTPLRPEDILHALGRKVRNGDYGYINMYLEVIGRDDEKLRELLDVRPDRIEDDDRRMFVQIGLSCLMAHREGWRAGRIDGWISAAS